MKKLCLILLAFCFFGCEKSEQKPATRHFDENVSLEKSEQSADINESLVPLPVPDLSHFAPNFKGEKNANFFGEKNARSVNFFSKNVAIFGEKSVNFSHIFSHFDNFSGKNSQIPPKNSQISQTKFTQIFAFNNPKFSPKHATQPSANPHKSELL